MVLEAGRRGDRGDRGWGCLNPPQNFCNEMLRSSEARITTCTDKVELYVHLHKQTHFQNKRCLLISYINDTDFKKIREP